MIRIAAWSTFSKFNYRLEIDPHRDAGLTNHAVLADSHRVSVRRSAQAGAWRIHLRVDLVQAGNRSGNEAGIGYSGGGSSDGHYGNGGAAAGDGEARRVVALQKGRFQDRAVNGGPQGRRHDIRAWRVVGAGKGRGKMRRVHGAQVASSHNRGAADDAAEPGYAVGKVSGIGSQCVVSGASGSAQASHKNRNRAECWCTAVVDL